MTNRLLAKNYIEIMFKNNRLLRGKMNYSCGIAHLSVLQIHTLNFLKQQNNAQMSEIAEYFHIEMPSATSLLNKLVALQLVKRQNDKNDRRMVRVTLTEAGNELLEKAMEEKLIHIEKMLSYLTDKEQHELLRLLEKLNDRIEENYEH
ncbi:MAG TPA: MarR family transcriptional regulator [Candidatus Sulfotelmatobacter sp.]|jgi:DNA-binding MarR family transcriptional regulator|nr:MarR family transcriptional regulator [Candidatus Sulfotelmatobacter sp.]